ncbi:cation diffusion facilitator family transporter [Neisseria sp. Ec49-e6-T10]|uniref:cation diffusion facilitator family transporter n=1 Tax=Neisseria sp. Ec49-e6-T10 TaxID=3140744 RepID=UPI003EBDB71C
MQKKEFILKLASWASIATAITLILLKTWAWFSSGSVSILASLIDSSMDSLASLISFFSIRIALTPPDKEHRFGHGKAESLAALAQAAFIAGSAAFLLLHSIERLIEPQALLHSSLSIWVMGISIILTLLLVLFQRWAVKQTSSQALHADSLHYASDLLSNTIVIIALILTGWGWQNADAYFGILLVIWIVKSAWDIAKIALNDLMDRELPNNERTHIEHIIQNTPGLLGFHDLKTRASGGHYFIQMHIELDAQMSFVDAHAVTEKVEAALKEHYPFAEIIVHEDPVELCLIHNTLK